MPKISTQFLLFSLFLASLHGCTPRESPSEAPDQVAETAAAPEPAPPIDPNTLPSPPESPVAQGPISNPDELRLRQMLETLSEAAEAAAAEDPDSGTHCERAYDSSRRLAIALSESMGGSPVQEDTPQLKARFVAGCERLPEETQRCMVMGYSVAHREECAELRRTSTPEHRAAVREIMTGLGPLADTALPADE